jgi:hypothetical protein
MAVVATGGDTPAPLTPINITDNKCQTPQFYWQNKVVTRIGYQNGICYRYDARDVA